MGVPKYCCEVEPENMLDIVEVVRCKVCKHRPHDKRGHGVSEDLVFPDDVCPLQSDDPWYSKYPKDNFFCAYGTLEE